MRGKSNTIGSARSARRAPEHAGMRARAARFIASTIVEVNSVEHESEEGKYMFDETNGISSTSERTI